MANIDVVDDLCSHNDRIEHPSSVSQILPHVVFSFGAVISIIIENMIQ